MRTLNEMHVAQEPQTYARDIPTHKPTSKPQQPFSYYVHSHRLAAEMLTITNNKLMGGGFSFVPSICRGFVNTSATDFLK